MKKTVFVVIIEEIHDQKIYDNYIKQVVSIIPAHNGEYIARSNKITPFAGKKPERPIVIGFDSMEEAKKCFYRKNIKKLSISGRIALNRELSSSKMSKSRQS